MITRIAMITTTYERSQYMHDLVKDCRKNLKDRLEYYVKHFIINDASKRGYTWLDKVPEQINYEIEYKCNKKRNGRSRYWKTYNNIFREVKKEWFDYVIFIADDFNLCDDFFHKIMTIYNRAPEGALLRFFLDWRLMDNCNGLPVQKVDGVLIMPFEYMRSIDFEVEQVTDTTGSSGVWRQLSKRLLDNNKYATVYHTDYSLCHHRAPKLSKMNPEVRALKMIKTRRYLGGKSEKKVKIIHPIKGHRKKKRDMRILYTIQEGLGNTLETVPIYLYLTAYYKDVDVWYRTYSEINGGEKLDPYREIVKFYGGKIYETEDLKQLDLTEYAGQITSYQNNIVNQLPIIAKCDNHKIVNEIGRNAQIAKKINAASTGTGLNPEWSPHRFIRTVTPVNWKEIRKNRYVDARKYDIVLCNGGLNNMQWARKRYARWHEVVKKLSKKYHIASVGHPEDYIKDTQDETGIPLLEVCDLISESTLFISNDCGLYHFANLIGKQNIVIFTATNIKKNYHSVFHRFAKVIVSGYECAPCQAEDWKRYNAWKNCKDWKCTKIDPKVIARQAEKMLK